jgi:hypothetical protein
MPHLPGAFRLDWGDEKVKEAYLDYAREVRRYPEGRKRDLSIRTSEIALRESGKLARLCGARRVLLEHFEWGWALASQSRDKVLVGANERMKVKRDFEALCRHIVELLADGPMRWMDIRTKCRSAAGNQGMEIVEKAMRELIETQEVREIGEEEQIKRGLRGLQGRPGRWFERAK